MDPNNNYPIVSSEENEIDDDNQVLLGSVPKKVHFQPQIHQSSQVPSRPNFAPRGQVPTQGGRYTQPTNFQHQSQPMVPQNAVYYPTLQTNQQPMNYHPQAQYQGPPLPEIRYIAPTPVPAPVPVVTIDPAERRRLERKQLPNRFKKALVIHIALLAVGNIFYGLGLSLQLILVIISTVFGFLALRKKSQVLHGVFIGTSILEVLIYIFCVLVLFPLFGAGFTYQQRYNSSMHRYEQVQTGINAFAWIGYVFLFASFVFKIISLKRSIQTAKSYNVQPEESNEQDIIENGNHVEIDMQQQVPRDVSPMNNDVREIVNQQRQQQPSTMYSFPPQGIAPQEQQLQSSPTIDELEEKYENELNLLKEMGFTDTEKTVYLLHKNNGNVQNVVQEYIQNF